MLIPYQEISKDALYSLAKEWVISNTSDTDMNPNIEQWTEQTIAKIKAGELVVEFGEESQTVTLKSSDEISFQSQKDSDNPGMNLESTTGGKGE